MVLVCSVRWEGIPRGPQLYGTQLYNLILKDLNNNTFDGNLIAAQLIESKGGWLELAKQQVLLSIQNKMYIRIHSMTF